jgi:hypothetical protein
MADRIDSYTAVEHVYGGPDPGQPKPGEMFVFRNEQGVAEMVEFLCPCGCGHACPAHVIPMAEKKGDDPKGVWKNKCWGFDQATLELYPSIRWTSGCKAHFNIDPGGAVRWHADSGK